MEQPPKLGESDRRRRSGGRMFRGHSLFLLIGHDFPGRTDESWQYSTHLLTGSPLRPILATPRGRIGNASSRGHGRSLLYNKLIYSGNTS